MRIVYRISEQDYVGACNLLIANQKPLYRRFSRRLMPWLGVSVLAMQALYLIVMPRPDLPFVALSCFIGLFLLYCGFAPRRYFRRSYTKDQRFKHEFTAEISDAGVHIVTSFSESQMKWTSFIRFLESDAIFMVFIAEWNFLIFPKRAFASVEVDEFRSLLESAITPSN
jgi:YcxB-like protein